MIDYYPGLAGIPAARSKISYLDGQRGILEYRGILVQDLAEKSNFLETAYLLLFEDLPTLEQLNQFTNDLIEHRKIKYRITDLIKCLPEHGHPMDALQAAVAALGMFYPDKKIENGQTRYLSAVRLIAKLPTIIASYHRLRRGDEQVNPIDKLDHTTNFFHMLTGKNPDPFFAKILDTCLILHAEHTMNASTFSGMVTASTLADPYTVVSSAIGTLRGPLHGGATQEVVEMFQEIGKVENVRPFLEKKIKAHQKIMGLGHREYKVKDPRAIILQGLARELFDRYGMSPLYEIALEVEKVGEELLSHKGVYPNVDFYSGIIYLKMGIEIDFFTPMFAIARVVGWLSHWLEQVKDNHIFRPTEIYEGVHDRAYTPIEER